MNADFAPLIVRKHAEGGWEVIQDDRTTGQLCFGEMIEVVVKLSNPGTPGPVYRMMTEEEWEQRRLEREQRLAQVIEP